MIHAVCDFCGKDCDRTAHFLSITPFSNFARYHVDDRVFGNAEESKSFVICHDCMESRSLPNPHHSYSAIDSQKMCYGKHLGNYTKEDYDNDPIF